MKIKNISLASKKWLQLAHFEFEKDSVWSYQLDYIWMDGQVKYDSHQPAPHTTLELIDRGILKNLGRKEEW